MIISFSKSLLNIDEFEERERERGLEMEGECDERNEWMSECI